MFENNYAYQDLNPQLLQTVEAELDRDEELIWASKAGFRPAMLASLLPMLFGIPFTAFAVVWIVMASFASTLFALFGLPFLFIGAGMLTAPLWVSLKTKRTAYAITDRRAIIFGGGIFSNSIRSFTPDELQDIERREKRDGSGSIIFLKEPYTRTTHHNGHTHHQTGMREIGFIGVQNAKGVESLLRKLAEQHQGQ